MPVKLKKQLGVTDGISYVTGSIIGSGIFISPSPILAGAGSSTGLALCVWLTCGVWAVLGSLCLAELAIRVRKSGGLYIFILEAFGENVAFVSLWLSEFILRPMSIVVSSLAAGTYILRPMFLDCPDMASTVAIKLLGLTAMVSFLALNCYSVKITAYIQTAVTFTKVLALVLISTFGLIAIARGMICPISFRGISVVQNKCSVLFAVALVMKTCFVDNIESDTENLRDPFETTDLTAGGLVFAFYVGTYAFNGGDTIAYAYEEYVNPKRVVIYGTVVGHIIPTIIYLITNIAYYTVLSKTEILSGVAVAVAFAEKCMGVLKWSIPIFVAISTSGIVNVNTFKGSRSLFVASREGYFPKYLSMINVTKKTLVPAIITMGMVACVIMLGMEMISLLKVYSFLNALYCLVAIVSIFKLRRTHNPPDALRLPIVIPVAYTCLSLFMTVATVVYNPSVVLASLLCISVGIVLKLLLYIGYSNDSAFRRLYTKIHCNMFSFYLYMIANQIRPLIISGCVLQCFKMF
ncbi:LOW QUALITY PROTEIN: cystine/glutamate transporter-like [Pecten maximus]|uniref:LOW QUALITY PROTEIN: cystine/glutamate transporter-like n=1 Tax=Pecten maximus TaxID=6579 RepID=UPI001458420A|nr:LOW QUALITY PROTEIN: cystine/glutamate transporter-like [Pecten maximus]